jgi:hypothetical protein
MTTLQELSTRTAILLVAVAFALFLAAGWFLLIGPQRSEAAQLQTEIEATRVLLAAPIPEPEAPAEVEAASERLMAAMPDSVDMPRILLELHRLAGEADVRLDSIAPSTAVAQATYQTLPINLTLQGSYFGFSDFLRRLRSEVRVVDGEIQGDGPIFSVDSITFGEGEGQFPRLAATLTISTAFAPTAPVAADPAALETEDAGAMPDAPAADSP